MAGRSNPFETLGISLPEARQLAQLDRSARAQALGRLRQYCAILYHPDKPGQSAFNIYNGAITTLEDPANFKKSLSDYEKMPPVLGNLTDASRAMMEQARHYREQGEKKLRQVEEKLKKADSKDLEMRRLRYLLKAAKDEIFNIGEDLGRVEERLLQSRQDHHLLKMDYEDAKAKLEAYKRALGLTPFLRLHEMPAAPGAYSIGDLEGAYLRIAAGLNPKKTRRQADLKLYSIGKYSDAYSPDAKKRFIYKGILIGGLEAIPSMALASLHGLDRIEPSTKAFDAVIESARPYVANGMFPVLIKTAREKDWHFDLRVPGEIVKIETKGDKETEEVKA